MALSDRQIRTVAESLLQSNTPTERTFNTCIPWAERLIDALNERGLTIAPKSQWGRDPSGRW